MKVIPMGKITNGYLVRQLQDNLKYPDSQNVINHLFGRGYTLLELRKQLIDDVEPGDRLTKIYEIFERMESLKGKSRKEITHLTWDVFRTLEVGENISEERMQTEEIYSTRIKTPSPRRRKEKFP